MKDFREIVCGGASDKELIIASLVIVGGFMAINLCVYLVDVIVGSL